MPNELGKSATEDQLLGRLMDHWASALLIERGVATCTDPRARDAARLELEHYVAELAGPDPSPTERTVAESAGLAWFALRLAEVQWSALEMAAANMPGGEDGPMRRRLDHAQRRIDRAHRRLMSSLRTLATVRKLVGETRERRGVIASPMAYARVLGMRGDS